MTSALRSICLFTLGLLIGRHVARYDVASGLVMLVCAVGYVITANVKEKAS